MSLTELEKKISVHINNLESDFKTFENILYNHLLIKDGEFSINVRLKILQDLFRSIESNKKLLIKDYNDVVTKNNINSRIIQYFDKYPDIINSNFNTILSKNSMINNYIGITSIKELSKKIYNTYTTNKNSLDINIETPYNIFQLSPVQKVLRNFINPSTPYYGLLIIHGTGVGKTCTGITIAENFKEYVKENNTKIQVIRPDEFQRQVFEISKLEQGIPDMQCTGETYIEEFSDSSDFVDAVKDCKTSKHKETKEKACRKVNKIITKKINEYYDFKSRILWTKGILDTLKNKTKGLNGIKRQRKIVDIIRQDFNNSIIIIDEAHNLRNMDLSSSDSNTTSNTSNNEQETTTPDNTTTSKTTSNVINIIKVLELVLLLAQNVRLVLLSATPMYDRASDIVPLINLMLLNDYRPSITDKKLFSDSYGNLIPDTGPKLLNKVSRGYISYVKGNDPMAFPLRLYADSTLPNNNIFDKEKYPKYDITGKKRIESSQKLKYLTLVNCQLSKTHSNAIINKSSLVDSIEAVTPSKTSDADSIKDLDITPVDVLSDDYKYSVAYSTELQLGNFMYNTPSEVKSDFTACYGARGFNTLFKKDKSGSYSPVSDASIDKFRLSNLNTYGPKIKKILDSIKLSKGPVAVYSNFIYGGLVPLIIALELEGYSRYANVKEFLNYNKKDKANKLKYVLYTGDKNLSKGGEAYVNLRSSMINETDVKVFLFSGAGSEGLSLFGYREIHIMEPWHNINLIEQSIGRVIRNKSHHHLTPEYRNVTVFLYTNTFSKEFSDRESIDLRIYSICEQKAIAIGNVELLLKSNAFDCIIARDNNIRTNEYFGDKIMIENSHGKTMNVTLEDIAYSRDTSYQKTSDYKCNINAKSTQLNLFTNVDYDNLTEFRNIYRIELRELKMLVMKILKNLGNLSLMDLRLIVEKNLIINPKLKMSVLDKIINIIEMDLKELSRTSTILDKNNNNCKILFINKKSISNLGIREDKYKNTILRLIPLKNYNKHITLLEQQDDIPVKLSKIKLKDSVMLQHPRESVKDINLIDLIDTKKDLLKTLQTKEDLNLYTIITSIQDKLNSLIINKELKDDIQYTKFNIYTNINYNNKLKVGYYEMLASLYDRLLINEKQFLNMYLVSKVINSGIESLTSIESDLIVVAYYNLVLDDEFNFIKKLDDKVITSSSSKLDDKYKSMGSTYLYDADNLIKNLNSNIKGFIIADEHTIKYWSLTTGNIKTDKLTSYTYLKSIFKDDKINLDKVIKIKYKYLSARVLSKVYGYLVYEKKYQQPKFKITDYISRGYKKSVKGIFCVNKQINEIIKLNNLLIDKSLSTNSSLIKLNKPSKKNSCGDTEIFFRLRNNYLKNNFDSKLDYGNIYFFNPEHYFIWKKYNSDI